MYFISPHQLNKYISRFRDTVSDCATRVSYTFLYVPLIFNMCRSITFTALNYSDLLTSLSLSLDCKFPEKTRGFSLYHCSTQHTAWLFLKRGKTQLGIDCSHPMLPTKTMTAWGKKGKKKQKQMRVIALWLFPFKIVIWDIYSCDMWKIRFFDKLIIFKSQFP